MCRKNSVSSNVLIVIAAYKVFALDINYTVLFTLDTYSFAREDGCNVHHYSSARSACQKQDYCFAVNRMREQTESMAGHVLLVLYYQSVIKRLYPLLSITLYAAITRND